MITQRSTFIIFMGQGCCSPTTGEFFLHWKTTRTIWQSWPETIYQEASDTSKPLFSSLILIEKFLSTPQWVHTLTRNNLLRPAGPHCTDSLVKIGSEMMRTLGVKNLLLISNIPACNYFGLMSHHCTGALWPTQCLSHYVKLNCRLMQLKRNILSCQVPGALSPNSL